MLAQVKDDDNASGSFGRRKACLPLSMDGTCWGKEKEGTETSSVPSLQKTIYLMLPYSLTVMAVLGIAEMSLETVILPSNISFTRAL